MYGTWMVWYLDAFANVLMYHCPLKATEMTNNCDLTNKFLWIVDAINERALSSFIIIV